MLVEGIVHQERRKILIDGLQADGVRGKERREVGEEGTVPRKIFG